MKDIFKRFLFGVITAIGVSFGIDAYKKVKDPVVRTKIKKKFINIKDIIFKKEEES